MQRLDTRFGHFLEPPCIYSTSMQLYGQEFRDLFAFTRDTAASLGFTGMPAVFLFPQIDTFKLSLAEDRRTRKHCLL